MRGKASRLMLRGTTASTSEIMNDKTFFSIVEEHQFVAMSNEIQHEKGKVCSQVEKRMIMVYCCAFDGSGQ